MTKHPSALGDHQVVSDLGVCKVSSVNIAEGEPPRPSLVPASAPRTRRAPIPTRPVQLRGRQLWSDCPGARARSPPTPRPHPPPPPLPLYSRQPPPFSPPIVPSLVVPGEVRQRRLRVRVQSRDPPLPAPPPPRLPPTRRPSFFHFGVEESIRDLYPLLPSSLHSQYLLMVKVLTLRLALSSPTW